MDGDYTQTYYRAQRARRCVYKRYIVGVFVSTNLHCGRISPLWGTPTRGPRNGVFWPLEGVRGGMPIGVFVKHCAGKSITPTRTVSTNN